MKIAIIGGSLLGEIENLAITLEERLKTPFGEPSDTFTTGTLGDSEVIYINRHGRSHHLAPHQINYRANMFGLKMLGVTHVIAVTAVGGITKEMLPMQWVVPDQLIDYTYGRMQTYNDGNDDEVNHIEFSHPFNEGLRKQLHDSVAAADLKCVTQATYGVTQGPRLETIAEIARMEKDGCDIVGMTAMPEAALARELEIEYAALSLVVNWAAGKPNGDQGEAEVISMQVIQQRIAEGNKVTYSIMANTLKLLN